VAASKLTPQQVALAKSAGFATNNQQAGALAAQNLAAAPASQYSVAPPKTSGTGLKMKESVGYQNDELNRIISLVHHR
jgi:hypothetical protein